MESRVVVRTAPEGAFENEIEIRGHRLKADESVEAGGSDRGPAPFELLLAALGACTSMTVRMYARRKGWDLRTIEVVLERVPLEGKGGAETEIRRILRVEGDLDADRRKRLVEIAEKCPVHRAMSGGARVVTTIE